VRDKTMVPWQGLFATYAAAKYVALAGIPGDLVECGVWRGGSAQLIAETVRHFGDDRRQVYLYDTFAGMTEPGPRDLSTSRSAFRRYQKSRRDTYTDWCYSPLEEVQRNLRQSGYPFERFVLVQGKVEDTIPGTIPERIALLRLDTDFYESTRHELVHLYPRLSPGGVLLIDDYGTWEGARQAVEEYFAERGEHVLLNVDTASGRAAAIKPGPKA